MLTGVSSLDVDMHPSNMPCYQDINPFSSKLPSILCSPAVIFSSALGIELGISADLGYTSVYTHNRNQPHYTEISRIFDCISSLMLSINLLGLS